MPCAAKQLRTITVDKIAYRNGVWKLMLPFPEAPQAPRVSRVSQSRLPEPGDALSGTFPDTNFALSCCSPSPSESSSDRISSSAKPGQPHNMCIKLPMHHQYQRDSCRNDSLPSPDHLTIAPLEPDRIGFSPALVGLTNRGEGHFQSIPALLPPLKDVDIRTPDQLSDLITPTPRVFHHRTGCFGQDALEKLKQNRPVRTDRASNLSQRGAQRKATRHRDVEAHDAAVVDYPGNFVQGSNSAEIGFRS